MDRKEFLLASLPFGVWGLAKSTAKTKTQVQLIRHATLVIEINGLKLLIDPMLSPKDEMDPVQNAANAIRIPMADLPMERKELINLLNEVDAVFVTHTHRDHWDAEAQTLIPKDKTVFCQPPDLAKIQGRGFINTTSIDTFIEWKGLTITRAKGQHGTGETGKKMGEVSGFIFQLKNSRIYVAGDTIWCSDVKEALQNFHPDIIVVNAGATQFLSGGPITMTPEDIAQVRNASPKAKIIAVHMDTINHCLVKRVDLKKYLSENNISHIDIPEDGGIIKI